MILITAGSSHDAGIDLRQRRIQRVTNIMEHSCKTLCYNKEKRGFTLTEIAIVLGIIGLILGAIWVGAGAVYQNLRVSKAQTELLQITQGIRTLYASQIKFDTAPSILETPGLIAANVFPSDAVYNSMVNSPWGGNSAINVYSQSFNSVGDSYSVEFDNIPVSACIALATGLTGSGRDQQLVGVAYQNNSGVGNNFFPINVVAATQGCTRAGGSTASISFAFILRGD